MASKAPGREVRCAAGSPGVLAGGDVRGGNVKRVASAVGEESIAVALFTRCFTSKRGRQCRPNRKADATGHRIRSVISKTYSQLLTSDTSLRISTERFMAMSWRTLSTKRVAAAVGEGSAAVRSVHEHLTFDRH
jgi:hypothetical protein